MPAWPVAQMYCAGHVYMSSNTQRSIVVMLLAQAALQACCIVGDHVLGFAVSHAQRMEASKYMLCKLVHCMVHAKARKPGSKTSVSAA